MLRFIKSIALFTLVLLVPSQLLAGVISLTASEDTFITQHSGLGGTSSVHGSDDILYVIGDQNSGFIATSLIRFDLSAFGGAQAQGAGSLELYLTGGWPSATVTVTSFESQSNWDEADSWNTMPGGAPYGSVGALQDQLNLNYSNSGAGYFSWDISQTLLQSWLDNPSTNYGLMITSGQGSSGHSDIVFASRESGNGPLLTFDVPAPSALLILIVGLLGFLRLKR